MSLDVYLERDMTPLLVAADLCDEHGFAEAAALLRAPPGSCLFEANITHNLNAMADAAGIYQACWRPEEIGVTHARQLVPLLAEGLEKLKADPGKFSTFDAKNGWGTYEQFVPWVHAYLDACRANPDAVVRVSR